VQPLFRRRGRYDADTESGVLTHQHLPDGGIVVSRALAMIHLPMHDAFFLRNAYQDGDTDSSENVGGIPLGLAIADDIFDSGLMPSPLAAGAAALAPAIQARRGRASKVRASKSSGRRGGSGKAAPRPRRA
jgi:hypothetical protein